MPGSVVVAAFGPPGCGRTCASASLAALSAELPSSANVTCTFNARVVATLFSADYDALAFPVAGYSAADVTLLDVARQSTSAAAGVTALWVVASVFVAGCLVSFIQAWRAVRIGL